MIFLKKRKRMVLFFLVFLLLLVTFFFFSFQNYLFHIQTLERISKVTETSNYTMHIKTQKRSLNRYKYSIINQHIYYDGIEEAYISYRSSTIFLKDALENNFITINDIIANMKIKEENENVTIYTHESKTKEKNYQIKIEEYETFQNIIISPLNDV